MGVLIAITSGFASGVFLRSLFIFGWAPVVFIFLLTGIFIAGAFLKPRLAYATGAVFCLFIALGMVRASLADSAPPDLFMNQLRHRVTYEGVVVSDPDVRDANQRVAIRVSSGGESTIMLAVASRSPSVMVGDRVSVSGTLTLPEAFEDNGRLFHYDKYLERNGIRFLLNFAYLRVTQEALWYSIPATLARVKHSFIDGLNAALPEPYSSLAGGVVIGGKTGLGTDLQDAFVRSGLVQIIVLSGYNVMIVAEWIMAALALTPLSRQWGAAAAASAVIIFVGIAGLSATAFRATLMAMIALYARATGRTYAAGRALFVAVFFMILWNPLYLAYDPGFDLSVVATAGLIWLAPLIENLLCKVSARWRVLKSAPSAATSRLALGQDWFERNALQNTPPEANKSFWINAVATTLAAQIAVLPLLLYDMGLFSIVAIPANLLAMPVVPLSMGLSVLAGVSGMLFGTIAPTLGIIIAYPAYLTNAFLIWLARGSASLPFSAFTLPPFPFWLVLFAYAALIFIASSKRFSTTPQLMLAKNASM